MIPPFPAVIDSTMIATFRACPQKFFREYIEHWKVKAPNVHLRAGAAYAKGLEVARRSFYEHSTSSETAIEHGMAALMHSYGDFECPPESAKSLERMMGAFEYYFSQYPLEEDHAVPAHLPGGRRAIEFSFAEPIPILHPQTQEPILIAGRCDMIAEYLGGLYIFDDKTTSRLGASWAKQWELRSQFTCYAWAAQKPGLSITGALIRGLSILKTKYETQQAITARPPHMVEQWYRQLLRDVERMIQLWLEGYWDFNLADACNEWGGCPFTRVCGSPTPEDWIEPYFEKRVWNPLLRKEEA